MKSKKKLIISLVSIVATLLVVIIASVVAINAAKNQNIASNIDVKYKVSAQVIGYVSATYEYGEKINYMTTNGENPNNINNYVWFGYQEKPSSKKMELLKDDLKAGRLNIYDHYELTFTFNFINTGYNDYIATLNLEDVTSLKNVNISYSMDRMTWVDEAPSFEVAAPKGLAQMSGKTCYVKIAVANTAEDAVFDCTFDWSLEAQDIY
jgi:hypothetical protein